MLRCGELCGMDRDRRDCLDCDGLAFGASRLSALAVQVQVQVLRPGLASLTQVPQPPKCKPGSASPEPQAPNASPGPGPGPRGADAPRRQPLKIARADRRPSRTSLRHRGPLAPATATRAGAR